VDIKEYIESGIIEAYATGAIPAEEAREVEKMAAAHPEIKEALEKAQKALEDLSRAYAVTPKPEWKDEILAAAFDEDSASTAPNSNKSRLISPWLVAASLALIVSLGINFTQYQQVEEYEDDLLKSSLRISQLEQENQTMVANYKQLENNFEVLRDPNTATFVMKGVTGRDPDYRADVYWNSTNQMVYLDVKNLPSPPPGKDYQLWALKDGKPVDMGVFSTVEDISTLLEVGQVPGAEAFAVTLEPEGGSENPTLEEMYVYGTPLTTS